MILGGLEKSGIETAHPKHVLGNVCAALGEGRLTDSLDRFYVVFACSRKPPSSEAALVAPSRSWRRRNFVKLSFSRKPTFLLVANR